ncbi:MAG: glucokinase [Wenzhouxiangellaceae bacterium]|nr:glucokinase [Wenzhouxiangellaceae bacterium]
MVEPPAEVPERVLVGDIGGTNARFALADLDRGPGERPRLHDEQKFSADDFASLQHAARHYLNELKPANGARPKRAAIAVACPVTGDAIRLTNRAWSFSRAELQDRLKLDELVILNDFGAAARAIPALAENEKLVIHDGRYSEPRAPISVIGPGTGMGVALITDFEPENWHVIETEGGHISFAPQGSEERLLHEWLYARHGRVSVERVLSGDGLSRIHAALAGRPPSKRETPKQALTSPAEIVRLALAGDDVLARRALARFCAILGSFAGDCALIHGARTVAIAGGMAPRFANFLRASAFVERFLDKGRFAAWLEAVRVALVTHPEPGLLGAALSLQDKAADG